MHAEAQKFGLLRDLVALTKPRITLMVLITTAGGLLVAKNGLSPYARSAFAKDATGAPRSPLFGVQKFTEDMHRLRYQEPLPVTPWDPVAGRPVTDPKKINNDTAAKLGGSNEAEEWLAKRVSYHTEFTAGGADKAHFTNSTTGRGPIEGRPPGEMFSHQRWSEYFPKAVFAKFVAHPHIPSIAIFGEKRCNVNISRPFWHVSVS